jgi:Grx4 family monothiol glutaredoxin
LDVIKTQEGIIYPKAVLAHPHIMDPQILSELEPYKLFKIISDYDKFYNEEFDKDRAKYFEKIKKLLDSYPVVIFIKGSPHEPFCKFSRSFIDLLKETNIKFKSFDIFKDEALRCWLRLYSGWKTYPQIYINGKIIGGVDVLKDLISKNEFLDKIPMECKSEGIILRLKDILDKNTLVVFGKGTGKSFNEKEIDNKGNIEADENTNKVTEIFNKYNLKYEVYDVLTDEVNHLYNSKYIDVKTNY